MRFAPQLPLPAYSYVPGHSPRPVGEIVAQGGAGLEGEAWRSCLPFLYGVDLFNYGYYWEAHESWETLWHAAGRRGAVADLLKGLIKLAAAAVKLREGNAAGCRHHAERAEQLFASVAAGPAETNCFGLDLDELRQAARQLGGPLAERIAGPAPTARVPLRISVAL